MPALPNFSPVFSPTPTDSLVGRGERTDSARVPEARKRFADQTAAEPSSRRRVGWVRQSTRWVGGVTWWFFCLASLIGLLAFVTAIPILQILSLGYLFLVAGRLAAGGRLREALPGWQMSGQIGLVIVMIWLASLPTRLLTHWQAAATIVAPGSVAAERLRAAAFLTAAILTIHLWWAWARGGRLRHYLWPEPRRFVWEAWRYTTWRDLSERLYDSIGRLQLPTLFWLGLRGAVGTLIWLTPAFGVIALTREGQSAGAGILGGVCVVTLAWVLMLLPMLQAHFAAEGRLAALFDWKTVRRDFQNAPWSWAAAMAVGLVLLPTPLYLLKIEATPQEVTWLPCLVFVAFMVPARIAEGLALRRCRRFRPGLDADDQTESRWKRWQRRWHRLSVWLVRLVVMPGIVGTYLAVLMVSQATSWDGLETWVRQHALLVPVPFVGL